MTGTSNNVFSSIIDYITSSGFILSVLVVVVGIIVLVVMNKLLKRFRSSGFAAAEEGRQRIAKSLFSISKYVVIILVIILVLQFHGVNVSALIAGVGVVGIVVGLALNDAIGNLIMGLHIVTDRFFRVGDVIKYGDGVYLVDEMTAQTVKLKNLATGGTRSISNRLITEAELVGDGFYADVLLPNNGDSEEQLEALDLCVANISKIEGVDNVSYAGIESFEPTGALHRITFTCNPRIAAGKKREVNSVIDATIREAGVSRPHPALGVAIPGNRAK